MSLRSAPSLAPLVTPPTGISDLIGPQKRKEYRTDLGSLTAFITIIGDTEPGPDDFEALKDFADLQKRQAERKLGIVSKETPKSPIAGKKPSELLPPT